MQRWGVLKAVGLVSSLVSADLYPCATDAVKSDHGPWTRSREKCSMSWVRHLKDVAAEDKKDQLELLESMSLEDFTAHYHIERGDCPPLSKYCASYTTWVEEENDFRRRFVQRAFKHVWDNYEKYAFGFDEIKPLTGTPSNYLGGYGCLILDSLDTLFLMGFKQQFFRAMEWVRTRLSFTKDKNVSMFETTIRLLGGLLGAYSLYPDPVFLEKAKDLGDRLLLAFRWHAEDHIIQQPPQNKWAAYGGAPTPIPDWKKQSMPPRLANESSLAVLPFSDINLGTGERANLGQFSSLAECILSPEFHALSYFTNDARYRLAADGAVRFLVNSSQEALFYIKRIPETSLVLSSTNNVVSMGSRGDSFYEYLLKTSIMSGHRMYEILFQSFKKAARVLMVQADKVEDPLLPTIFPHEIGMIETGQTKPRIEKKMDHLACFLPGVYALDHMYPNGVVGAPRADTSDVFKPRNETGDMAPDGEISTDSEAAAWEDEALDDVGDAPSPGEPGATVTDFTPIPFLVTWQGGELSLNAVPAMWNRKDTTVLGNLQFGGDACTITQIPTSNDEHAVLFANRGNCTFQVKARHAKSRGFGVVLVADYRNSPDRLHTLLPDGESNHADSAQLFFTDYLEFTGDYWAFRMKLKKNLKNISGI